MNKSPKFDHKKAIGEYAKGHYLLIQLGRLLAGISAIIALIPYYLLWKMIKIAIEKAEMYLIKDIAWEAVGLTVLSLFIYIMALMFTHIAAFRVQANMRSSLMRRIITLPLGVFDEEGTGRIRRIVNDSTAATETYIAHILPDKTVATVTPIGILALVLIFDWRMGLICLLPALLGFI